MGRNKNRDNQNASQETEKSEAGLPQLGEYDILNGSSVQPAIVKVAGFELQLGQVVRAAWQKTGFTVEEWNALSDEAREAYIAAEIDVVEEGGQATVAAEGLAGEQPPAVDDVKSAPADEPSETLPPVDTPVEGDAAPAAEVDEVPVGTVDAVEAVVETNAHASWVQGVLDDYVAVMGPGKYPSPEEGARAQRSLLHALGKLEGLPVAQEVVRTFFRGNKDGITSERNLARFVSSKDAEALISLSQSV